MGKEFMHVEGTKSIFEEANQTLGYDLRKIMLEGPKHELNELKNATNSMIVNAKLMHNKLIRE